MCPNKYNHALDYLLLTFKKFIFKGLFTLGAREPVPRCGRKMVLRWTRYATMYIAIPNLPSWRHFET